MLNQALLKAALLEFLFLLIEQTRLVFGQLTQLYRM